MATKTTAPYGSWPSPVTPDLVLASTVQLAEPFVSPDGKAVAWLEGRAHEKGRNALVYARLDGAGGEAEKEEVLPDLKWNARSRVHEYGGGAWAFDADGNVVFSSVEGAAYRVKRSGDGKWSEPEQITPSSDVLRFADFAPHPSRSDVVLAVQEDHTTDLPSAVVNSLVAISRSASGKPKLTSLVSGNDFYSAPRWSASGEHVAWVTWQHPDMPWEASELHVAHVAVAEDGEVKLSGDRVVNGKLGGSESISQPRWSAEGEKLVFLSDKTGFYELYSQDAAQPDAGVSLVLEKETGADAGGPDWVFGQSTHAALSTSQWISTASGGALRVIDLSTRKSIVHSTPYVSIEAVKVVSPTSVLVLGKPAAAPAVLSLLTVPSSASSSALSERVLQVSSTASVSSDFISSATQITYPVTLHPDASGLGHALFYPPASGSHQGLAGALPPLIARCHGGPTAGARRGLDWVVAWFTSRGFAFVDVDYGGSTGYGKEYRDRLKGNWGLVDVQDTIDCVEHLVKEGKADREKVAITGGSAGGFTVLAALCSSKVFTAGTSSYGISDLALLAGDTHKFESQYLFKLIGGTPEEVPQNYHDRSPLFRASEITAPLLLLQGSIDRVVPPEQSQRMLDEIRGRGGVCEMELFEGEGHGWRAREAKEKAMKSELGWYRTTWGLEGGEE
ncbi:hypothetical protein JCM10207_004308 [Rhodosporidiobolus poonsookiae]